jgi:large repetitive protein
VQRRRVWRLTGALLATAGITLGATTMAHADNTVVTGDAIVGTTLALGDVCRNTTVSKTLFVHLTRNGGSQNSFKNSTLATVSVQSVTGAGLTTTSPSPATISIPSNWSLINNNTIAPALPENRPAIAASLSSNTLGSFTGEIVVQASGSNAESPSSPLSRTDTVKVTANVKACDTTPPVLTLPSNQTIEATGPGGATFSYTATATDANPANPAVTCTPPAGTFPIGTTTVNCSAIDAAGNTGTGSFTVTVRDTTGPAVGTPTVSQAEATSASGATVDYATPTATDVVDGARPVTCGPPSGTTFAIGSTPVTCSAQDTRGNTGSATFNVIVVDSTKPVLTLPAAVNAEATGPGGAAVDYNATASDIVDGAVTPQCTPASGATFALGDTTVECSATDRAGNTTTGSFAVSVVDTTAPAISVPSVPSTEATGPNGATVSFDVTADDLVDGDITPECDRAPGSTFGVGTTEVTCTATDTRGNRSTESFNVTVTDTTAPSLTLPADLQLEATGPDGAAATFAATARDLVDGDLTVDCDGADGAAYALGVTTVNCSVTDRAGNRARGSFTIEVRDTTAPTVTAPANLTEEATGPDGAPVSYSATANDLVDGPITPDCHPGSGASFGLGVTTVSCTATDTAGNTSAPSTFTVKVQDTTAPVLTLPGAITVEATSPAGAVVPFTASADDLVSGSVTPDCDRTSGSTFGLGTTTVSCSATDAAGNRSAPASFDVIVQDTIAPSVECAVADAYWHAANQSVVCEASDDGSGVDPTSFTLSTNVAAGTETADAQTGTHQACDAAGNCTPAGPVAGFKVDKKAPTAITFHGAITDGASFDFGSVPAAPTCSATDGGSGLKSCTVTGHGTGVGNHTLEATATDNVGNEGTRTITFTVKPWSPSGFYQPVDMSGTATASSGPIWNTVKNGSTVPLKFRVYAGPTELTSTSIVNVLSVNLVACTSGPEDIIETLSATVGTSLRYDTTGGQFIYNWQTPKLAGKCYKVVVVTADGSQISAFFKLK